MESELQDNLASRTWPYAVSQKKSLDLYVTILTKRGKQFSTYQIVMLL